MPRSRDTSKGLLIATVLAGAWRSSEFPALDISESDLDEITPILCVSGAAALAWYRIRHTNLQHSSSAEGLHQSYRHQSLQWAIQEEKIEKVFRLLRAVSVDAILAKGWAAAGFYSNPDLRPYGDIDICVRPADFRLAEDVLSSPEASECNVDLHKHFSEIDDRTIDELFARSRLVQLGSEQIRILGPEDHLALLCLHLLKHGARRPIWLCDIAAALESAPATFDWHIFLGTHRRRASWIAFTVGVAHRVLGARIGHIPIKPELMEGPAWLAHGVIRRWSRIIPLDHFPLVASPLAANNLKFGRPNIFRRLIRQWPDPIMATYNLNGEFNNFPRFPFKLAVFIQSVMRYLIRLPTKLQSAR
jgi:hypothetical protein